MASQFEQRVRADLNEARRSHQKERTVVLTTFLAELRNKEIEVGRELTEEECLGVASRSVKQRRDAVSQYRAGGREDLVAKEDEEIAILQRYLPEQLTPDDVRTMVRELVAGGADNLGAVMKQLSPRIKGRFDGGQANRIVKEVLGG
ncbi:MAG: GatB/YqeY domain-containing protein [Gemmatimonadetes bacterium]|nr:GatB/YqeY domain-containing protein [Gemmatimonadota bacterium]